MFEKKIFPRVWKEEDFKRAQEYICDIEKILTDKWYQVYYKWGTAAAEVFKTENLSKQIQTALFVYNIYVIYSMDVNENILKGQTVEQVYRTKGNTKDIEEYVKRTPIGKEIMHDYKKLNDRLDAKINKQLKKAKR